MVGQTSLQDEIARDRWRELLADAEEERLITEATAGRPNRSLWIAAQRAVGLAMIHVGQRLAGTQRASQTSQRGMLDRSLGFAQ